MRAALYRRLGGPEVLELSELDRPEPGPGEVRVRVVRSAVNPTDCKSRSGMTRAELAYPFVVPHQDGAGVIDAVGAGVDSGRLGQRVWLYLCGFGRQFGSAAEAVALPEDRAVPLPDGAGFDLGASLGVPALTAWHALFSDGPLDGATVLVAGGAGAVGHFAIELARRHGARVVTTVSSEDKAALARAAGAEAVVNYREEGAGAAIAAAAPDGVDRVVEVDLAANLELDLAVCRSGATVMTYAAAPRQPELVVRSLMNANLTLRFMLLYAIGADALAAAVAGVQEALEAGALSALPEVHFDLDHVGDAHRAVEQGAVGKVLVDLE